LSRERELLASDQGVGRCQCLITFGIYSPQLAALLLWGMSSYIHKSHNVTVLLYHLVFPAKYRRAVIDPEVDQILRNVCLDIEARYEIKFLEIGTDKDHVHFLVQSVPMYSVKKIVQVIKSITAREVFQRCPQVKKRLWGGEFWSDGYFASTVGKHGDEAKIGRYVQSQGQVYKKIHEDKQLSLF
jgi:putative transposase